MFLLHVFLLFFILFIFTLLPHSLFVFLLLLHCLLFTILLCVSPAYVRTQCILHFRYFYCSDSMIRNDARRTREIKSSIITQIVAFNTTKTFFTSKLDSNLSKKQMKCYIWSIDLYRAETWLLWKVDQR
jgi:hypothetical protein